ncbi:MAG: hypothetical protein M0R32_07435 [Candidatus Cloacimonetes bacterium]|nr:hypothetical protein [Candidatus Cloacimonadota bacterium]
MSFVKDADGNGLLENQMSVFVQNAIPPIGTVHLKSKTRKTMGRFSTFSEFVVKASKLHNDLYDYSLVDYKNCKTKVKIICKNHGVFEQSPEVHLRGTGRGCQKCAGVFMDTSYFIERSRIMHGTKYDYSCVDYLNSVSLVNIICPIHGLFKQSANSHLKGNGCNKCSGSFMDLSYFIERSRKIHGDKYDYSKTVYNGSMEPITITCKLHGDFKQIASTHLRGCGCKKCSGQEIDKEIFIKSSQKIHGDKYDYSAVKYIGDKTEVSIICKKHGAFPQLPCHHKRGIGCPFCKRKYEAIVKSILEKELKGWAITPGEIICSSDFYRPYCSFRRADFVCRHGTSAIWVEYDGEQHFEPIRFNGMSLEKANSLYNRQKMKDELDDEYSRIIGIPLYRIKFNENLVEKINEIKIKIGGLKGLEYACK